MEDNGFLKELLGIDKLRVTGSEIESAEQIPLSVESIEEVVSYPECGQLSLKVHGLSEEQIIRDLPFGERRSYLRCGLVVNKSTILLTLVQV